VSDIWVMFVCVWILFCCFIHHGNVCILRETLSFCMCVHLVVWAFDVFLFLFVGMHELVVQCFHWLLPMLGKLCGKSGVSPAPGKIDLSENAWYIGDVLGWFHCSGHASCQCMDGSCSDGTSCSFFVTFEECAGHCWNVGYVNDALLNKWWKVVQVFNMKLVIGGKILTVDGRYTCW